MKNLLGIFLLISSLSSCSWLEHFAVRNLSDNPIYVSYTITEPQDHNFGIFEHTPTFYKVNLEGHIDWSNKVEIADTDNNKKVVSVILPAKTIMLFGKLNNDNYKSYDQYFINGREFNLDFMEIEIDLQINHISKTTFDDYFSKQKGLITYDIK